MASKERSANKSEKSYDKTFEDVSKSRESNDFKQLKPIEEVDEYIDPRLMENVKTVSFNNPVIDSSE